MPADMQKLVSCLAQMKATYLADATVAVRGQTFIYQLHKYCVDELNKAIGSDKVQRIDLSEMKQPTGKPHYPTVPIDPQKYQLMQEVTLFGSHKNKDEDIALTHFANGPQIAIGVRSQMSSVGKNLENYYEGIIGECISLAPLSTTTPIRCRSCPGTTTRTATPARWSAPSSTSPS